ncbi:helix-turn-helix domain-containing protein [Acetobacterium paludosum]|uniref:Helix-turn-helix domain-containing protein n=1 Tax=Acetobacterium paludosum TaxID=52693 RepID=A0A923KXC7_9FIRM|nr:helix-turn-helix transcriptional regulator [Acetobacterium paludosum]MBC3889430.1 helix-turn-helix domain-containing protein [Acetobacterium paludosum]
MSKLQEMRKKRMLSQNDLVKASGVSRTIILKYESGEREINKAAAITLLKLSTALSCKIEDLLENTNEEKQPVLFNMYKIWREDLIKNGEDVGLPYTWDSGEASAREDFANYWIMSAEISFVEMLELEKLYDANEK